MVGNSYIMSGKKEGALRREGRDNRLNAAWLAQLGQCQSCEWEVAGSIPSQTNTLGL